MRVAFAFHKAYPLSVGGAERYYWTLARAAAHKRPVTYLTDGAPEWPGVEVIDVARGRPAGGFAARQLAFAAGLLGHLFRHGARYDVVHCCCFPHVAVIAAWLGLLRHRRSRLVVDWHELIPLSTWRRRRGLAGLIGYALQQVAVRLGDRAVCFSELHLVRLRRYRPDAVLLPEFLPDGSAPAQASAERDRSIVFAGRLVAEKRAALVPHVLRELRRRDGRWRALIFGDGPAAARVRAAAAEAGVSDGVELKGFADWPEVSAAMSASRALVLPSAREGFGLVVLEAAAHGLPSVLVAGEGNAASELIEPGRNGLVCSRADPAEIADAVLSLASDDAVHARTAEWFEEASRRYSADAAVIAMEDLHSAL